MHRRMKYATHLMLPPPSPAPLRPSSTQISQNSSDLAAATDLVGGHIDHGAKLPPTFDDVSLRHNIDITCSGCGPILSSVSTDGCLRELLLVVLLPSYAHKRGRRLLSRAGGSAIAPGSTWGEQRDSARFAMPQFPRLEIERQHPSISVPEL